MLTTGPSDQQSARLPNALTEEGEENAEVGVVRDRYCRRHNIVDLSEFVIEDGVISRTNPLRSLDNGC